MKHDRVNGNDYILWISLGRKSFTTLFDNLEMTHYDALLKYYCIGFDLAGRDFVVQPILYGLNNMSYCNHLLAH